MASQTAIKQNTKNTKNSTTTKPTKPTKPTEAEINAAMAVLGNAGMMDKEAQAEAAVSHKIKGYYVKVLALAAALGETLEEGDAPAIVIFANGEFCFTAEEETTEEPKRSKKKDPAAQAIVDALIIFQEDDDNVTAETIREAMGGDKPPAITTIYTWLSGRCLPNKRYHRALRALLGLSVG